jgi:hypothetical protein
MRRTKAVVELVETEEGVFVNVVGGGATASFELARCTSSPAAKAMLANWADEQFEAASQPKLPEYKVLKKYIKARTRLADLAVACERLLKWGWAMPKPEWGGPNWPVMLDGIRQALPPAKAQPCGHPATCIGKVDPCDENEQPHCLWCGDITDMKMLVNHLSRTYDHFTDGRISFPTTLPEEVFAVAADCEAARTEAAVNEATSELKQKIRGLADYLWQGIPGKTEMVNLLYKLSGGTP